MRTADTQMMVNATFELMNLRLLLSTSVLDIRMERGRSQVDPARLCCPPLTFPTNPSESEN